MMRALHLRATVMMLLRLLILLAGISAIFGGYYLMFSVSIDSPPADVIRETKLAIFLSISGGLALILYLFIRPGKK